MQSVWGKFTIFPPCIPDKMTIWGKMWWENSCGGWPRQNCCVWLWGHLLIWHIHNPISDVWKAYERSILISKAHTRESNTRQQHQKQVCFYVIYSFFNPGLVYSLCSEEQIQPCLRALWSVFTGTCDSAVCKDVKNMSPRVRSCIK